MRSTPCGRSSRGRPGARARRSSSRWSGTWPRPSASATPSSRSSPGPRRGSAPSQTGPGGGSRRTSNTTWPGPPARTWSAGDCAIIPRASGRSSRAIRTSSRWGSRATWACRCSTATAGCSATWRSATSGPCPPSPAGCSSSGSSPPGPPSSWSGCGSRSSSSRASGATGSSTRRHPMPTWRSASIDGS